MRFASRLFTFFFIVSLITVVFACGRSSLEPECAATREQIKTVLSVQLLPEPVEQGLSHAVRRRAEAECIRKAQHAAAPLPGVDADLILRRRQR